MARIFTTGLEEADLTVFDYYTNAFTATDNPRSGIRCLKLEFAQEVRKFVPNLSELWLRFAYSRSSSYYSGDLLTIIYSNTNIAKIALANGVPILQVGGNTVATASSVVVLAWTYYLFEVHYKLGTSDGIFELKVDGVLAAQYTGNTNTVSAPHITTTLFYNQGGISWWDDFAINDPSGSVDNNWCGDGRVILLKPNAAGDATQWTASSGANYTCVDEGFPANDDTDYVYSETVDDKDLYNLENPSIPSDSIIRRVWVTARAKKTVSDAAKIALGIKTGGTEYWDSDQDLLTSYKNFQTAEWRQNPSTSSDWTISDLNDLQVGIKAR